MRGAKRNYKLWVHTRFYKKISGSFSCLFQVEECPEHVGELVHLEGAQVRVEGVGLPKQVRGGPCKKYVKKYTK